MNIPKRAGTRLIAICVFAAVGLHAGSALAQVMALGEAVEPVKSGKINWTTGWVIAVGKGAPPVNPVNSAQSRMMAERAAKADAYRNLLEVVNGVRVDAATLVENFTTTSDVIKVQVGGLVKGAIPVKTESQPDGGAEVTMKMPLWGDKSLATILLNEKKVQAQDLPQESASDEGITGLVIDARGLGVKPACFPSLVDQNGVTVFGPEQVDRATAEKDGMIQYRVLPKDASLSFFFDEGFYVIRPVEAGAAPREGRRPLKIKATDKAGVYRANIMISSDDAQKIKDDPRMKSALARSKVVVVTDPLIGGMEGRGPAQDAFMLSRAAEGGR